jgi:hypothetical protein
MRISIRTFYLISLTVLLLLHGLVLVPMARQWMARDFPATEGTVCSSATSSYSAGIGIVGYSLAVQYEYTVNGTVYQSARFRYDSSTKPGVTEDEAKFWPKGRKITVYYNSHKPQDSLLAPGIAGDEVLALIKLTPFDAIALSFVFWVWAAKRKRQLQNETAEPQNEIVGGVELIGQAGKICARLPHTPLIFVAVIAFSVSAVVGGAISSMSLQDGLYFRAVGPIGVTVIWLLTICAGITPVLIHRHRIRAGRYDLVIDETGAVIDLPPTCGRKERRRIPFDQIQVIGMAVRETPKGEVYVPTLEIAGGIPTHEDLAVMEDRERALRFMAWLRQKLPHVRQTSDDAETEAWLDWFGLKPPQSRQPSDNAETEGRQ